MTPRTRRRLQCRDGRGGAEPPFAADAGRLTRRMRAGSLPLTYPPSGAGGCSVGRRRPALRGMTCDHVVNGMAVGSRRDTRELYSITVRDNEVEVDVAVAGESAVEHLSAPRLSGRDRQLPGVGERTGVWLIVRAVRQDAAGCNSKRRPSALVTLRMVDQVGLPSAESAL